MRQGVLHALQGISEREVGAEKRGEHVARSLRKLRQKQSEELSRAGACKKWLRSTSGSCMRKLCREAPV